MSTHKTREEWLMAATGLLDKEFFVPSKHDLPKLRVSCGFCGGKSIGVCLYEEVSADQTREIFVDPSQDEGLRILDILLHELLHAALPQGTGHTGEFRSMALGFGFIGKMTTTEVAKGSELDKQLHRILEQVGKYPHAALKREKKVKQPSRWVRFVSTTEDTFKVVVHIERVAEFGPPKDPWGNDMEPV